MDIPLKRLTIFPGLSFMACFFLVAAAAADDAINFQAYLNNVNGEPVNADVPITFAAYKADVGGAPLWSQDELVVVEKGLVSVMLGSRGNPFPTDLFDGPVYIGLFVADQEILPRRPLPGATFSSYVFEADADAVGASVESTGYAVIVPSLTATGNIGVGLTRVFTNYALSSTSASCHSHGNLACYYGSGSVACPVGTRVLGGGTSGTSGLFGSVASSYPPNNTSWNCGESYDISGSSRNCYAICARLD